MDRIDIHLTVPAVDVNNLMIGKDEINRNEKSETIKQRIVEARKIQSQRFKDLAQVHSNSDMKNRHLKEFANLNPEANLLLKQAVNKFNLSARVYFRLIKVARTIADLDKSKEIKQNHIAEALQYRVKNDE
jgi:magnesium chelatase family protein